jgi:putative CocE/NonD family hydrolase
MRDGVRLYGAIYRPSEGNRFPVLLLRSPYSTQYPRDVEWAVRFAEHGYAVVLQDCRGRYESEGKWRPYIDEAEDGYDTQEWIGQQNWCDGNIGTFGISYPGFTQIQPAPLRSSCVKALVPIAHQEDNYGHLRYNGVLQQENSMNWVWLGDRTNQNAARELIDWDTVYRRLPLLTAIDDIAERPFYREIIRHARFDEFWKSCSMKGKYSEVETPAYFITGWYDNLLHETLKCFHGWKHQSRTEECRRFTRLMVGPWTHSLIGSAEATGEIGFGPRSAVDIPALHLRWYDQRLREIDTGIDDEMPVRLFVMGVNAWRSEDQWPLARTRYTSFHLHSDGRANSLSGDGRLSLDDPIDEPPDTFEYDPENPVPTVGGQSMFLLSAGPRDRRSVEQREDVLVYSTASLEEDLEVTGPVELILYASSTAPDTDFTATLADVHPSGRSVHICEGIVRARFRESYENPTLIKPGKVYELRISLWETSNVFKAGHKVRVEISSSNFPRFDRNLNTGNEAAADMETRIAHQTILHNARHPSRLVLPIIPRR